MRPRNTWFRAALLAAGLALLGVAPAAGHGGPPRVELSAVRLQPGATLEVRGINLDADEVIRIVLAGPAGAILLGEVLADSHGDCAASLSLPVDTAPGVYAVQASAAGRLLAAARLQVAGVPVSTGAEDERRDESEPLLAPMPVRQAPAPARVSPARQPVTAAASSSPLAPAALAAAAGLLAALGLAGAWRYRRSRQG